MTNRLAVFASYSKEEKILRSTIYYLSGLRKICQKIIFVSDNALPSDQKAKVEKTVDVLICKRHGEYDFGSYKRGFEYAEQNGLLNNVDELIFCNDSCYGPVFPLDAIFKRMDEKRCDFWGMIDSHEIPRHICSFFFLFKRKVFEDPGFSNFVHSWTAQNDFWGYVLNYEKKFTHVLEELGYKYGIVCDLSNRDRGECQKKSGNGFLGIFPCLLHSYGMPLIKKKVFNGAYGNDLHENPYKLLELIKDANEELYSIIVEELQEGSAEGNIDFGDRWAIPSKIFEKKSIVSFNIFDTLLIRPYKTLNDLFYHIEAQYNCCGFASARIEAEYRARCKYKDFEDVSLDQIYECIRPSIFKSYKAIELEWEKRILQPNPKILDFYNEAVKCKKKIVAVSDTYFSKEFLLETLKLKGYDKVSEVFVSCERNACKHNGKLFRIVKDELKSSGTDIVHIGSNSISDKASPEALGIAALQISTIVDDIKEKPGAIFCAALSKLNSLSFNILSGMFAYYKSKDAKKNSFYELGYFLAGPLAVGYSQYIQNTCLEKGIENVLFVSRDCCVLREVYNIIFLNQLKIIT